MAADSSPVFSQRPKHVEEIALLHFTACRFLRQLTCDPPHRDPNAHEGYVPPDPTERLSTERAKEGGARREIYARLEVAGRRKAQMCASSAHASALGGPVRSLPRKRTRSVSEITAPEGVRQGPAFLSPK